MLPDLLIPQRRENSSNVTKAEFTAIARKTITPWLPTSHIDAMWNLICKRAIKKNIAVTKAVRIAHAYVQHRC